MAKGWCLHPTPQVIHKLRTYGQDTHAACNVSVCLHLNIQSQAGKRQTSGTGADGCGECCAQAGISTADRVVTVSPGYAWEIQTPEGGWGMEALLASRAYALNGVLNGIDGAEWSPASDPHLPARYGPSTFSRGKAENKAALQRELALPERPEARPGHCALPVP